jgi:O-antigen/teichoic acid export membrane protein
VVYGLAGALTKLFSLFTFPVLARHFTVAEYGTIDFFSIIANLIVIAIVFGQESAVARFFYESNDTELRKQIITQSLLFQLGLTCLAMPLLWGFADNLVGSFLSDPNSNGLFSIVVLQTPFFLFANFSQGILRWTFKRRSYLIVSIGSTVFAVVTILIGILIFRIGIAELLILHLVCRMIFGLMGVWLIREWLTIPKDMRILLDLLRYAAPLGVIAIASVTLPALERSFIIGFLNDESLGLYAAGSRVALLIVLPITAFQIAWGPFSLAIFKETNAAETYNWVLKTFAILIFALVISLTMVADPLLCVLASSRYRGGTEVVFAIAMSQALQSVGWITEVGIGFSKKSFLSLYSYAVFLICSLLGMLILVQLFGLLGIAWGSLIGYLLKSVTESFFAQKAHPLPWAYSSVVYLGALTFAIGIFQQYSMIALGPVVTAIAGGIGVLLILSFGWCRVFNPRERKSIVDRVRRVRVCTTSN